MIALKVSINDGPDVVAGGRDLKLVSAEVFGYGERPSGLGHAPGGQRGWFGINVCGTTRKVPHAERWFNRSEIRPGETVRIEWVRADVVSPAAPFTHDDHPSDAAMAPERKPSSITSGKESSEPMAALRVVVNGAVLRVIDLRSAACARAVIWGTSIPQRRAEGEPDDDLNHFSMFVTGLRKGTHACVTWLESMSLSPGDTVQLQFVSAAR